MNKVQLKFLEDCQDNEELLNDWERGFIDSLSSLEEEITLTQAQNETLNKIVGKINRIR